MSSIELHAAQRDEVATIENMMQFYLHDFSEWLPLKLGEQGLFNFQIKPGYWRNPATRPFLIKVDGELGGFVVVDADTHLPGAEHNIGYFFVSRRFRGQGVAKFVVSALLSQIPGQWQIFHIDANQPARRFWARLIPAFTEGNFTTQPLNLDGYPCTLYRLESSPQQPVGRSL